MLRPAPRARGRSLDTAPGSLRGRPPHGRRARQQTEAREQKSDPARADRALQGGGGAAREGGRARLDPRGRLRRGLHARRRRARRCRHVTRRHRHLRPRGRGSSRAPRRPRHDRTGRRPRSRRRRTDVRSRHDARGARAHPRAGADAADSRAAHAAVPPALGPVGTVLPRAQLHAGQARARVGQRSRAHQSLGTARVHALRAAALRRRGDPARLSVDDGPRREESRLIRPVLDSPRSSPAPERSPPWRWIGPVADGLAALAIGLVLVLVVLVYRDYGITWDETWHLVYGDHVYEWYATLGADRSALCYRVDFMYGGGFDLLGSIDRKSTRLNSSHSQISYAVFCLKKK